MAISASTVVTQRDKDRLVQIIDLLLAQRDDDLADFLRYRLARATVITSEAMPRYVATMNSRVRCRDDRTGETFTLSLVYPGEEDSTLRRLSVLSPMGAALLGLAEGQSIEWAIAGSPPGKLTLLSVLFQPEAAGRLDL